MSFDAEIIRIELVLLTAGSQWYGVYCLPIVFGRTPVSKRHSDGCWVWGCTRKDELL